MRKKNLKGAPLPSISEQQLIETLQGRFAAMKGWLQETGCATEQKHLIEGTPERVYWHYGYAIALRDVLAKMNRSALH